MPDIIWEWSLVSQVKHLNIDRWYIIWVQSSGAVWKSRWPPWAPVPNMPTVSVDVKQHFIHLSWMLHTYYYLCIKKKIKKLLSYSWQFSETYGVTSCGSGWRTDVVNQYLEFEATRHSVRSRHSRHDVGVAVAYHSSLTHGRQSSHSAQATHCSAM